MHVSFEPRSSISPKIPRIITMKGELSVHLVDSDTVIIRNNGGFRVESSSPITPTLVLSAFAALLGSLSFGLVIGYSSPVQSAIMKELGLSTAEYSLFGSINNIGGAVGAILCGKLTDYFGRRRALGVADVIYIIGWLSIAIGQDAWLLNMGRWMLGFAMAISSFAVIVYVAEFTPTNLRGGFVVLHVLMVTTGGSIMFLLGLVTPWRTLALIGIIPSLIQIISVFFIPESPRWLMMIGEDEEFEAALRRFRGPGVDISQEVSDIKVCAEVLEEKEKVSLVQLFGKKYAYTLTVGIGLSALSMLVGLNGIIFYSRSVFESAGFSGTVGTVTLALFQIPPVLLGIALADKCGRRPLLMISSAGLGLGCSLAGLAFVLKDRRLLQGFSPCVALTGILVYAAAYPIGIGGVSAVIVSEIFPLNIKGLAGSVTTLVSWLSGWLVSYVFNFFMEWSSSGTFFILAGACVVTFIFVAKLVPETKGKTLEEIHLLMRNFRQ